MNELKCINCGAPATIPDEDEEFTCPECGFDIFTWDLNGVKIAEKEYKGDK